MVDEGEYTEDGTLRKATVEFAEVENQERAAGMSGGLMYNKSKNAPAGIIMRGSSISDRLVLQYLPFSAVFLALSAIMDMEDVWSAPSR